MVFYRRQAREFRRRALVEGEAQRGQAQLRIQVVGQRGAQFLDIGQQPRQTHPANPANTRPQDSRQQQLVNKLFVRLVHEPVRTPFHKSPPTILALIVLLSSLDMPVFYGLLPLTSRTFHRHVFC